MSRWFSDEPVKLIRRIPTPEQLSAARPLMKASFGQRLVETLKTCAQAAMGLFAPVTRSWRRAQTIVDPKRSSRCGEHDHTNEQITDARTRLDQGLGPTDIDQQRRQAAVLLSGAETTVTLQPSAVSEEVQPEEVAELRSFLLRQQQDIVHLSVQIQELKSLVVSQQQVLVYLGKELEVAQTQIPAPTAVASAPAKRNRIVREKTTVKDKPIASKGTPIPSLNL